MSIENAINPIYLGEDKIKELAKEYENAVPWKHLMLDNFLNDELANSLFENFPPIDNLKVKRKSLNEDKAEDYHFENFHPSFSKLRAVIQSPEFYNYMSKLTGLKNLITTNDAMGSGVHQGKNGSYVDVHVDINMNVEAGLWRRINLLIYLNKNWQPEYGGDLEVWDKEMKNCHKEISPVFNRAVIFYTDDNSPHGYSKINIPEGETRKSFYTYFYTEIEEGVKYRDSRFVSRPDDSFVRKTVTNVKESLKINAKKLLKAIGVKSLDFQDKNKY